MVILTDPDFSKGYHVGRDYYFHEAPEEEKHPADTWFMGVIHEWALGYHEWHEADAVLNYVLGCRTGALSAAIIPVAVTAVF